jgi:hypothetical protein
LSADASRAIFFSAEPKPLALICCFAQVLQRTRLALMQ